MVIIARWIWTFPLAIILAMWLNPATDSLWYWTIIVIGVGGVVGYIIDFTISLVIAKRKISRGNK